MSRKSLGQPGTIRAALGELTQKQAAGVDCQKEAEILYAKRNRLALSAVNLVRKAALLENRRRRGLDYGEAESLAWEAALLAAELYHPDGGATFLHFCYPRIMGAASSWLKSHRQMHRLPDDADERTPAPTEPETYHADELARLYKALDSPVLSRRHRKVLRLHYLEGKTAIEIAQAFGKTVNQITYALRRATVLLRAAYLSVETEGAVC